MKAGLAIVHSTPPGYWVLLVTRLLGASEETARHLWKAFEPYCGATIRWQLSLCSTLPTLERQEALLRLIPPKDLLHAAEKLRRQAPRRRQEVIALEEAILHYTTATGQWK